MPTLYLHIGMPKTGTTAIQLFCRTNRAALARKGYCFMQSPYFCPNVASERNGNFLVHFPRKEDGSFATAEGRRVWQKGMQRLSACFRKYPNVILSDESILQRATSAVWADLKAEAQARGFEIRMIVYLRRQDQYLVSDWAQRIKWPRGDETDSMPFAEMVERADEFMCLDYASALDRIAEQFGREVIDVRVYERKRFPQGDIVKDFLNFLGLADEGFAPIRDQNSSLYGNALEIRRVLNTVKGIDTKGGQLATKVARMCLAIEGKPKAQMFTQEESLRFLARYEESNRRVAREYLGDESGALFAPPNYTEPKWEPKPEEMYETIIRFFSIAVFTPPKEKLTLRIRRFVRRRRSEAWALRQKILRRMEK